MDPSPSPELNEESMLEKDDGMFGESAAELVVESEAVVLVYSMGCFSVEELERTFRVGSEC